jgi:hypothetical protein
VLIRKVAAFTATSKIFSNVSGCDESCSKPKGGRSFIIEARFFVHQVLEQRKNAYTDRQIFSLQNKTKLFVDEKSINLATMKSK